MGLQLEMTVNHHVGARALIQDLCKSNQQPLLPDELFLHPLKNVINKLLAGYIEMQMDKIEYIFLFKMKSVEY